MLLFQGDKRRLLSLRSRQKGNRCRYASVQSQSLLLHASMMRMRSRKSLYTNASKCMHQNTHTMQGAHSHNVFYDQKHFQNESGSSPAPEECSCKLTVLDTCANASKLSRTHGDIPLMKYFQQDDFYSESNKNSNMHQNKATCLKLASPGR